MTVDINDLYELSVHISLQTAMFVYVAVLLADLTGYSIRKYLLKE